MQEKSSTIDAGLVVVRESANFANTKYTTLSQAIVQKIQSCRIIDVKEGESGVFSSILSLWHAVMQRATFNPMKMRVLLAIELANDFVINEGWSAKC